MVADASHHQKGGDQKGDVGHKDTDHALGDMIAQKIADQPWSQILRRQCQHHHRD